MNQTTRMHQISEHLPEYEHSFSPYYWHHAIEILRRLGLIEFTIAGSKLAGRCRAICGTMDSPSTSKASAGGTTWW
jgi:hypothetical protein